MEEKTIVKSAVFQTNDETYYLNPKENLKYVLEYNYYGDHNENWIVAIDTSTNKSLSAHNLKFCVNYLLEE